MTEMRTLIAIFVMFPLLCLAAGAVSKNPVDFPLDVVVVETHWSQRGSTAMGYGHGNIKDSDGTQGFDFTYQCVPFNPTQEGSSYPGRWKKQNTRLLLLTAEVGDARREHECELKTTPVDVVYGIVNGRLVSYNQSQYAEVAADKKILWEAANPTDINMSDFPLTASITNSNWHTGKVGGVIGAGQVTVRDGDTSSRFDFNALCLAELDSNSSAEGYKAQWKAPAFNRGELFEFQTISIRDRQKAEDALPRAKSADSYEEFGKLAREVSEDAFSLKLGDHQMVERQKLSPATIDALVSMRPGQISDVVMVDGLSIIFRLNDHIPAQQPSLVVLLRDIRTLKYHQCELNTGFRETFSK
jgi:hypothetical protein